MELLGQRPPFGGNGPCHEQSSDMDRRKIVTGTRLRRARDRPSECPCTLNGSSGCWAVVLLLREPRRAPPKEGSGFRRRPHTAPGSAPPPRLQCTEGPLCPFEDHLHREPKFGCSPWPVSDATRRHSRYFLHSTVQWTRGGLQVPECASRVGSRAAFARVERRLSGGRNGSFPGQERARRSTVL